MSLSTTSAAWCHANHVTPGDYIVHDNSTATFAAVRVYQVTAIGELHVLAKLVEHNGEPKQFKERLERVGVPSYAWAKMAGDG